MADDITTVAKWHCNCNGMLRDPVVVNGVQHDHRCPFAVAVVVSAFDAERVVALEARNAALVDALLRARSWVDTCRPSKLRDYDLGVIDHALGIDHIGGGQ